MAAVRGNYPSKVDEKGRLKLPVEVRDLFKTGDEVDVFITSSDGIGAEIWPMETWLEVEEQLSGDSFDPNVQQFVDVTNYYGRKVSIDNQGRVLMPQLLREEAGLTGEVAVLGKLNHLLVMSDANFRRTRLVPLSVEQRAAIGARMKGRLGGA